MKILFIIPTFFARPEIALYAIRRLAGQIREQDNLVVVHDTRFTNRIPKSIPEGIVVSQIQNVPLGKAVNLIIRFHRTDHDIICWLHDDMIVQDKEWVNKYLEIVSKPECGIVGIRNHSEVLVQRQSWLLSEVTWTDGIMMCRHDVFKEINGLDEEYLADCESQDICFRLREKGYKIYRLVIQARHMNITFFDRRREETFWDNIKQSRDMFWDRWEKEYPNQPGFPKKISNEMVEEE